MKSNTTRFNTMLLLYSNCSLFQEHTQLLRSMNRLRLFPCCGDVQEFSTGSAKSCISYVQYWPKLMIKSIEPVAVCLQ